MTVYYLHTNDGRIIEYGQPRLLEKPVLSVEVPVDEFCKAFPDVKADADKAGVKIIYITEGMYDDELTKIVDDVVASRNPQ